MVLLLLVFAYFFIMNNSLLNIFVLEVLYDVHNFLFLQVEFLYQRISVPFAKLLFERLYQYVISAVTHQKFIFHLLFVSTLVVTRVSLFIHITKGIQGIIHWLLKLSSGSD